MIFSWGFDRCLSSFSGNTMETNFLLARLGAVLISCCCRLLAGMPMGSLKHVEGHAIRAPVNSVAHKPSLEVGILMGILATLETPKGKGSPGNAGPSFGNPGYCGNTITGGAKRNSAR